MANFSDSELELIKSQKKSEKDLPEYFKVSVVQSEGKFSTAGLSIPISRDFESYLILQTQDQKQKTLSWVKKALDIQKHKVDRDDILNRYFDMRTADADNRISELDTTLDNFDQFKVGLLTDSAGGDPSRFASVEEVNLMTQSLQGPIDDTYILRDRAFHEKTTTDMMRIRLASSPNTDDTRKSLQDWQTVISAYPGQSMSGASLPTATPARGLIP